MPQTLRKGLAPQVADIVTQIGSALAEEQARVQHHPTRTALLKAAILIPKLILADLGGVDTLGIERIALFKAGEFHRLVKMADEAVTAARVQPTNRPADPRQTFPNQDAQAVPRNLRLMSLSLSLGEASRAMTEGMRSEDDAPIDSAEMRAEYAKKVPKYPADRLKGTNRPSGGPVKAQLPHLTKSEWRKLIREGSRRSSGGPSGWRFSLLRSIEPAAINLLQALWTPFTTNDLDEESRQILRTSRAVCIPKRDGGVRPLAIGETFRRLLCKAVLRKVGNENIERAAGPYQFAAGTVAGTDIAGAVPRLYLESRAHDRSKKSCLLN